MRDAENTVELPLTHATAAELRGQLSDEQAAHAKTISNFEEFADSVREDCIAYRAKILDLDTRLHQTTRERDDLLQRNDRLAAAGHRLVQAVREHNTNPNHGPGTGHTDNLAAQLLGVIAADRKPWTRETSAHEQDELCTCSWLGVGMPEHQPTSFCLTPEQDQANRNRAALPNGVADYRMPLTDFERRVGVVDHQAVASVPRDAREWPLASGGVIPASARPLAVLGEVLRAGRLRLVDQHAVRQIVSPEQPVDELPPAGTWGPYELEREVLAEPMPVAVRSVQEIADREDGPAVAYTVQAHLDAALESARLTRGAVEHRVGEWMARKLKISTVQVILGWIRRAYAAGEAAGAAELAAMTEARDVLRERVDRLEQVLEQAEEYARDLQDNGVTAEASR
ncbi:hypothetical protein [Actinoplanes sp. NPDC048796]|uniref:hypothetical protein n=1 Tax=Actinoplanes sp. NPDC048796 TaxID=3155640 RepID=UPI0033C39987